MTMLFTPDELLTTTRTVRRRLDFERPVPRHLISECIDIALQAPTGSLKQNWHWIVVGDPAVKAAVTASYQASYRSISARHGPLVDGSSDPRTDRLAKVLESAAFLVSAYDLTCRSRYDLTCRFAVVLAG